MTHRGVTICVAHLIGGIDLWSCLVDPSIPRYWEGG
jgi:hypothetical protein